MERKEQFVRGYRMKYAPEHPMAMKNATWRGWLYEHIYVASSGGTLEKGVSVHHIDGDKLNNEPQNLMVMSGSDHSRLHALVRTKRIQEQFKEGVKDRITIENILKVGRKARPSKNCSVCEKTFSAWKENQRFCSTKCMGRFNRKVERPSREVLARMVWEMPVEKIAKGYGLNGNAVRKWCKKLQIPCPGLGYWAKRYAAAR